VSIYYEDDLVTLYHGDCREITAWLEADLLVTDPPYGVDYAKSGALGRGATIAGDCDFTLAAAACAAFDGSMAVFANHKSLANTIAAVSGRHERMRVMTWHKSNVNGGSPGNPWLADVEFAVCGVTAWPTRPVSALISARRFTGNPAWNSSPDAYLHPAQKPIPVMESVILAMPEGTVADPFAGSGSTLRAAKNLGRRSIGVEVDERYCEIAAKRLAQDTLFGGAA
jgi:DNA modification methylase